MFADQLGTLTDRELETLCTPLKDCLSVKTGPVDPSVVSELELRRFDQAPVYHLEKEYLLGLVQTERLRRLHDAGEPLSDKETEVCNEAHQFHIGCFVTLEQILEKMGQQRAVFVISGSSATEYGYVEWNYGLLTVSDLNRHPFRAALYTLFAELESGMAVLVESACTDPWTWVKTLAEEHQVRVLGYWELAKRRGVDVGPIAATTLSQFIQVIAKNKEILMRLGYSSRNEFEAQTGTIPELRNCVMHPVRPIVFSQGDVGRIRGAVECIADLHARVEKLTRRSPRRSGHTA
jgi:hypothetical protein